MCTGRVDLSHFFHAFSKGIDGVFIGGCRLSECSYSTHGNYHALNLSLFGRKIMEEIGLYPERLKIEFMSSGEGQLFVKATNVFIEKVRELGKIGVSEGLEEDSLNLKLNAVKHLIPYLRLVENERFRANFETKEEIEKYYSSEEFYKLFRELVLEKLAVAQIMLLLREKPLSTEEISNITGMSSSEISRHLNYSSKQGFIRFDEEQMRFAIA